MPEDVQQEPQESAEVVALQKQLSAHRVTIQALQGRIFALEMEIVDRDSRLLLGGNA